MRRKWKSDRDIGGVKVREMEERVMCFDGEEKWER
jgi:hypothetical protein